MNKQFYLQIPLFLFICLCTALPLSSQTPTASFSTWKDNKKAAYSIIHDDYSNYVTGIFQYADPIATARGIKLCFGAITNPIYCGPQEWANARTMISHGHECINHSHNHLCGGSASQCSGLSTYGSAQFATELGLSSQTIEANTGVKPRFFIHPYDASSDDILNYLTGLGYLGTRAGTQEAINTSSFTDFIHLNFFIYSPTTPISSLNQAVDQAVASGGYAIREFHGVADGSWAAMSVANYTSHLDYVKTQMNNGNIWSATTTEAITYKMQRDAFQPSVSYAASTGVVNVSFNTVKTIDPSVLSTPVTLNINLNGIPGNYNVTQNGSVIPSVRIGDIVTINIYPHQGNVILNCTNCTPTSDPVATNVTNLTATPQTNAALVSWTNPTTTFGDVLVVAKAGGGFTTQPTAPSYIADANFTGSGAAFEGGKVVYQGIGANVTVTNLTAGTTYYFRVYTRNGTTWSSGVETTAIPTAPTSNTLGCLRASYYNNNTASGTAAVVRYETAIDYSWGSSAPVAGVISNKYSVEWKGSFTAPKTGSYTFTIKVTDGTRMWINNNRIINEWSNRKAATFTGSINLIEGATYPIIVDYKENKGTGLMQLKWTVPAQTIQIMPFASNCTTLNSARSADLVSLDGRLSNGKASIQWIVNSQKAVDYYQLEKLDEQGEFKTLSIVNDNNTTSLRYFSFIDDKLSEGENYYRIQTNFADNTPPQYSTILKINYLKPEYYSIFPNPAHDFTFIDLSQGFGNPASIRIFSIIGKELFQEKIESAPNAPYRIDLSQFETGQYLIRVDMKGKRPVTRKLVVGY